MARYSRELVACMILFAIIGAGFAGVSTYDFALHLDRQVHSITCSYIPGTEAKDTTGQSGCFAVMMSPYSSVFRDMVWGGIPIALPGLAVFAYLIFLGLDLLFTRKRNDPREMLYAVAATLLPVITSLAYFYIAKVKVGAVCKLCVGIYAASAGVFLFALLAYIASRGAKEEVQGGNILGRYVLYFVEGVVFVLVAVFVYLNFKPVYGAASTQCGELLKPEDKYAVLFPIKANPSGLPTIEVVDPLCPVCKGFRDRLDASGLAPKLDLKGLLFPLDKECNWMVNDSMHPGACAVSEAIMCVAPDKTVAALNWALDNQAELKKIATEKGSPALYERLKTQFPETAECLNKPDVKTKLNRSLRFAVANAMTVLTPQLYVNGKKLCDEDTDLGLEFSLSRMLSAPQQAAVPAAAPAAPAQAPAPAKK